MVEVCGPRAKHKFFIEKNTNTHTSHKSSIPRPSKVESKTVPSSRGSTNRGRFCCGPAPHFPSGARLVVARRRGVRRSKTNRKKEEACVSTSISFYVLYHSPHSQSSISASASFPFLTLRPFYGFQMYQCKPQKGVLSSQTPSSFQIEQRHTRSCYPHHHRYVYATVTCTQQPATATPVAGQSMRDARRLGHLWCSCCVQDNTHIGGQTNPNPNPNPNPPEPSIQPINPSIQSIHPSCCLPYLIEQLVDDVVPRARQSRHQVRRIVQGSRGPQWGREHGDEDEEAEEGGLLVFDALCLFGMRGARFSCVI